MLDCDISVTVCRSYHGASLYAHISVSHNATVISLDILAGPQLPTAGPSGPGMTQPLPS